MTLEELKQDDWYKSRSLVIQQAIDILPPIQLYKLKDSGKQCYIRSYEEPESGKIEDVTVTVVKKTDYGIMAEMGNGVLGNSYCGLSLDDLKPWDDE